MQRGRRVEDAVLAAAVIQEAGTEDLSGEDKEQWQDGLQQLKSLGMADDEAEKSLKRGFGWSSQAYWWKDKVKEVPRAGEVCKPIFLCWNTVPLLALCSNAEILTGYMLVKLLLC